VYGSNELPHEEFTVSYILPYAKRSPIVEWRILDDAKDPVSDKYRVTFPIKKGDPLEIK